MYHLSILPPSVNSMCVRVLLRANNLEHTEEDVYGRTQEPEYLAKCPAHHAPLIESDDLPKGCLIDSVAIMQFLAEKHGLTDWYPLDLGKRAMTNACVAYQAGTLYPLVGKTVYPLFGLPPYPADLRGAPVSDDIKEAGRKDAQAAIAEILDTINSFFFEGDFIGGDKPNIADARFASTMEWLPVAKYDSPQWLIDYLARMENHLGDAYTIPAQDVRGFVADALGRQS